MSNSSGSHHRSRWKSLGFLILLGIGIGIIVTGSRAIFRQWQHKQQREHFFQQEILPLLEKENDRNLAAVERAKEFLDERFTVYSARVPKFVAELMSLTSAYRISKAELKDMWNHSNELRQYTTELFNRNVMSDADLRKDLGSIVLQFHSDLEANRNWMLSQIIQRIRTSQVPVPKALACQTPFVSIFNNDFTRLLKKSAESANDLQLLGNVAFIVQPDVEDTLTATIETLTDDLISLAAATTVGGSGTDSFVGAASGTLFEPGFGTAIGCAVGAIVGSAGAWWMDAHFKKKTTIELRKALDKNRDAIWGAKNGLHSRLSSVVKDSRQIQEQALRDVIIGGV